VQSVVKESHCGVFMLDGVVRGVWSDSVCECRFTVYGNSPVCSGPMDGNVKEVYLVVCLAFQCELECQVYCAEVCQYVLGICVVGVIDDQYVVNVCELFYDHMLVLQVWYMKLF